MDARVLRDVDAGGRGSVGETAYEPCRLQHTVRRMEERRRIALERRRETLPPVRGEPRGTQRVVLVAQLIALLGVDGEPQAPVRRNASPASAASWSSSASVQRHRSAVASSPIARASTG